MKPEVLVDYIIKPALERLAEAKPGIDSPASVQMMLAIAAQESHCGLYFKQIKGPAMGVWQVEPDTHDDVWANYIKYQPAVEIAVSSTLPDLKGGVKSDFLLPCPMYCCAIARLCLYRHPEAMPEENDRDEMWEVYKKRYNSVLGAATHDEWVKNWARYVEGVEL